MKNIVIFLILAFCLVGCAFTSPKLQLQTTHNKTWGEMFDNSNWSAINNTKFTENNKVVK